MNRPSAKPRSAAIGVLASLLRPRASRRSVLVGRARRRGLTLMEMMITIGLVAIVAGALVLGGGFFTSGRLRLAATALTLSVRSAMAHSAATGKPVRLVFDIDGRRVVLEEASSSLMVRDAKQGPAAGAAPATSAEQAALDEAEGIFEGPRAPQPRFTAVSGHGFEGAQGRALGAGVVFKSVHVEHDEEPRTEGRAYLYFWPRGGTERAAIQLAREGSEDTGLTIVVSALTGRARIERGLLELPEQRSLSDADEGYSEREDDR